MQIYFKQMKKNSNFFSSSIAGLTMTTMFYDFSFKQWRKKSNDCFRVGNTDCACVTRRSNSLLARKMYSSGQGIEMHSRNIHCTHITT